MVTYLFTRWLNNKKSKPIIAYAQNATKPIIGIHASLALEKHLQLSLYSIELCINRPRQTVYNLELLYNFNVFQWHYTSFKHRTYCLLPNGTAWNLNSLWAHCRLYRYHAVCCLGVMLFAAHQYFCNARRILETW